MPMREFGERLAPPGLGGNVYQPERSGKHRALKVFGTRFL